LETGERKLLWVAGALATSALIAAGCSGTAEVLGPTGVQVTVRPLQPAGARTVTFSLARQQNQVFTLGLDAREVSQLTGVGAELRFDPSFLNFRAFRSGPFLGSAPQLVVISSEVPGSPGTLLFSVARSDQGQGQNGSGTLAELDFEVRRIASAQTTITFALPQSSAFNPQGATSEINLIGVEVETRIVASD